MTEVTVALRDNRRSLYRSARHFARASLIRGKLLIVGIGMCLLPALSFAVPITFTGSSGSLSASASFDIVGNDLFITLTNTANYDPTTQTLASNQALTGLFFDLIGGPTLTPSSATIASGSTLLQSGECNPGACPPGTTNVGGEFIFDTSASGFPDSAFYGIASSGYIDGPSGNFGGPNLDNPNAPNGANFAIVPSGFVAFDGNGGLDNDPLIQNAVQFVLTGVSGLSNAAIGNVSFQYGTGFNEPNFPGDPNDPGQPPQGIPEPATLFLFGTGLLGLGLSLRRKHIHE